MIVHEEMLSVCNACVCVYAINAKCQVCAPRALQPVLDSLSLSFNLFDLR